METYYKEVTRHTIESLLYYDKNRVLPDIVKIISHIKDLGNDFSLWLLFDKEDTKEKCIGFVLNHINTAVNCNDVAPIFIGNRPEDMHAAWNQLVAHLSPRYSDYRIKKPISLVLGNYGTLKKEKTND